MQHYALPNSEVESQCYPASSTRSLLKADCCTLEKVFDWALGDARTGQHFRELLLSRESECEGKILALLACSRPRCTHSGGFLFGALIMPLVRLYSRYGCLIGCSMAGKGIDMMRSKLLFPHQEFWRHHCRWQMIRCHFEQTGMGIRLLWYELSDQNGCRRTFAEIGMIG